MNPEPSQWEREQRFREIYDAAYVDLLRVVRRRIDPAQAKDVVGDVSSPTPGWLSFM